MITYWTRVFDRGSSRNETVKVMLNILLTTLTSDLSMAFAVRREKSAMNHFFFLMQRYKTTRLKKHSIGSYKRVFVLKRDIYYQNYINL